jgi:hypothetical protein
LPTRLRALALAALVALAAAPPAFAQDRVQDLAARWGLYARLAGSQWMSRMSTGDAAMIRYAWVERGRVLRAEHRLSGTPYVTTETISLGDAPGELMVVTVENDRATPARSVVSLNADGSAVERFVGRLGLPERATYTPLGPDRFRAVAEVQEAQGWREIWSSEITRLPAAPGG